MEVIYTCTKLGSQFNIKETILKSHNYILYHIVYTVDNCNED